MTILKTAARETTGKIVPDLYSCDLGNSLSTHHSMSNFVQNLFIGLFFFIHLMSSLKIVYIM